MGLPVGPLLGLSQYFRALKVLKKQMFTNPDDPHELAMIPKNEKKPDYYARKTCNLLNTISEVFFSSHTMSCF